VKELNGRSTNLFTKTLKGDAWISFDSITPKSNKDNTERDAWTFSLSPREISKRKAAYLTNIENNLGDLIGLSESLKYIFQTFGNFLCPNCGLTCEKPFIKDTFFANLAQRSSGTLLVSQIIHQDQFSELTVQDLLEMYLSNSVIIENKRISSHALKELLPIKISDLGEELHVILASFAFPLSKESSSELILLINRFLVSQNYLEIFLSDPNQKSLSKVVSISEHFFCSQCKITYPAKTIEPQLKINEIDLKILFSRSLDEIFHFLATLAEKIDINDDLLQISRKTQSKIEHFSNFGFKDCQANLKVSELSMAEIVKLTLAQILEFPLKGMVLILDSVLDLLTMAEVDKLKKAVFKIAEPSSIIIKSSIDQTINFSRLPVPAKEIHKKEVTFSQDPSDSISINTPSLTAISWPSGSSKARLFNSINSKFNKKNSNESLIFIDSFTEHSLKTLAHLSFLSRGIAKVFSSQFEARRSGFQESDFNISKSKYRCKECRGIVDRESRCETCLGLGFATNLLSIQYQGMSFIDILSLTVTEAEKHFYRESSFVTEIKEFSEFGFADYRLNESLVDFSQSEIQRLNLFRVLFREDLSSKLIFLDNPFWGMNNADYMIILRNLNNLVSRGATFLISSNDQRFLNNAHYVIKIGS